MELRIRSLERNAKRLEAQTEVTLIADSSPSAPDTTSTVLQKANTEYRDEIALRDAVIATITVEGDELRSL